MTTPTEGSGRPKRAYTEAFDGQTPISEKKPKLSMAPEIVEQMAEEILDANPPPIESNLKVIKTNPKDLHQAKATVKTLESAAKEIEENLEKFTEFLKQENVEERTGNQVVSASIDLYELGEQINSVSATIIEQTQNFMNFIGEEIAAPEKKIFETHAEVTKLLDDAAGVLSIIKNSSLLSQKKVFLAERKEKLIKEAAELEKMKATANLKENIKTKEKEIRALKESIQKLSYEITESTKTTILQAGLILPDLAKSIYSAIKFFGNIQNQVPISSGIDIAGGVVGIISAGHDVYIAGKNVSSHKKHVQDLEGAQLEETIINAQPNAPTNPDTELSDDEITIKGQTAARLHKEAKKDLSEIFSGWIIDLKKAENFKFFKENLAKRGIILDDTINSYADFDSRLHSDQKFRSALEQQFIRSALEQQFNSIQLIDTIGEKNITANQKTVKKILDKRHQVKQERIKEETTWFNKLINDYENDFIGFKTRLGKEGIRLLDAKGGEIESFSGLTDEIKNQIIEKHIEYKDTLTITAKSQLKVRLKAHEEINYKFFKMKLTKSKILFGLTTLSGVAGIALSAGLIAGLAFPPSLFLIPTVIGIVTLFGSIAIGLYYFHKEKPNLAKTYFEMIPLEIKWNQLLMQFTEFSLWLKKCKIDSLNIEMVELADATWNLQQKKDQLNNKTIDATDPDELTRLDKIYEEQKSNIQEKKEDLRESIESWDLMRNEYQKKINDLNNRVLQARKDDFELKTGFKSFSVETWEEMREKLTGLETRKNELYSKTPASLTKKEKNEVKMLPGKIKHLEDKMNKAEKDADEFTVIAEALIKGEFWKDPEATKLIHKYGGVELEKELKLESDTLETNKTFLSQKLRDIILRNSKEILEWLEKQNIREVEI